MKIAIDILLFFATLIGSWVMFFLFLALLFLIKECIKDSLCKYLMFDFTFDSVNTQDLLRFKLKVMDIIEKRRTSDINEGT